MKKFLKKNLAPICGVGLAIAAVSSNAYAALDVTGVTFDVSAAETIAGVMLVGIGLIWGIKRVIALASR